ncbi:MAG: hypothetical protein K2J94_00420 [Duncaniella sp.]|nr:hypothetical protein [Duncaniella sp.]
MTPSTATTRRSLRALFVMLLAFTAFTSLSSCEPDDDPFYFSGTWVQVAPAIDGYASYTFYDNGTGYYYVNDAYGEDVYDFGWWTDGPAGLVIDYGYGETYYFAYSMQGNSLYLYPDDGSNPLVLNAI